MVRMDIVYAGNLRCRLKHGPSGQEITTDAPLDNNGKGEAFSPTDLLASSLGACMMTVMGIVAARHSIRLDGTAISVEKEMIADPIRRIKKLTVRFQMVSGIPEDKRNMLETAAHSCPVHKSLHPDVDVDVAFSYA